MSKQALALTLSKLLEENFNGHSRSKTVMTLRKLNFLVLKHNQSVCTMVDKKSPYVKFK